MKILYLAQYFNPPEAYGGSRHYEMARRLVERGHEVHIITSAAFRRKLERPLYPDNEFKLSGVRVHVIEIDYHQTMNFIQRMASFIRFALKASLIDCRIKPDVIFASSTPLTIAIPGIAQSFRRRAPMVFEVRDLWPEIPIAIGALRSWPLRFAARMLERIAYARSTRIVALSSDMKRGIARTGFDESRIEVIPNGCDFDRFEVDPQEGARFKAQFHDIANRPWILYSGAFGRINGLEYLVEAASRLKRTGSPAVIVMIGAGSEKDKLMTMASDLGVLNESLFFLPPRPKTEMPAVLSAADICCSTVKPIPQLAANCANKVFDSLASSRPVFINYGGWQADMLEETSAGIADRECDPQAGAQLLNNILMDSTRLESMKENARKTGRERFDRDLLASKLEHTLSSAIASTQ